MKGDFVNLHVHSHYSLLEALPKVSELVFAAAKDGQKALALTDNGNLYATIDFYKRCKDAGIKPIVGVEFFIAPRKRTDKEYKTDDNPSRLVLLAEDQTGYKNLIRLVTKSFLEGFHVRPRVDRELLEEHKDGLVAILPTFDGEHIRALLGKQKEKAREIAAWYQKMYPENVYLQISDHPEIRGDDVRMKTIAKFSLESGIPLVAAQDTYYLKKEDEIARLLVNKIRTGGTLNRSSDGSIASYGASIEGDLPSGDFSLLGSADAQKRFANYPEALSNTARIAQSCNLELSLGAWVFPEFPLEGKGTHDEALRALAYAGFAERNMPQSEENKTRIEYELSVIKDKGYAPYFLVVADLLRHAREQKILTNTRGSAAGSLVSYLSRITTVNPIEYELPFERFLNPERPSPPDIDMDLADNRRDELIDYVRTKYGESRVAQIGTFGTMMARAAVRDVSRALGYPYSVGDRIAKLIPFGKQGFPVSIQGSLDSVPELKDAYKNDPDTRDVVDLALKIEGNARHVGVHAAGVVIAPSDVIDYIPIQFDPKGGKKITQYDMHAVEDAGLLKFDFLGLTNLSVLADSVARVKDRLETGIDLDRLPLDDYKTFGLLSRGETLGVFQLAGSGITSFLIDLKPTSILDINAMVALYRPGPMASIPAYIERKHNLKLVKYLDPRMEPILKKSYGLIVYQDDVLQIAITLAGYSWLEADKLRKAMGKKIPAEMAAQKERFTKGCVEHGMSTDVAQKIWQQIETFAAYGFGKAHAASYGNLAYKTAYMKANFPVDYMAALLTADAGDVEKIAEAVAECTRMGIKILPPSINESKGNFTVIDDTTIRFGLYSIKNFGTGVADSIIASREKDGPFPDVATFLSRVTEKNLNRKSLESLIKCGALDEIDKRGPLLFNLEKMLAFHREHTNVPTNQASLFGAASAPRATLRLESAPAASLEECLAWEKELLGLYVSGHPLDKHREKLQKQKTQIKDASIHFPRGIETVIAGFLESARPLLTKKGERMIFGRVADYSGSIEIVAFPRVLSENTALFTPGNCLMLKGKFADRNGEPSFIVERVKAL